MTNPAVYLETFGCQMNELDSQLVHGALRRLGYAFTQDPDAADVVLYNTCSVREQAEQKVWSRLGELKHAKHDRPHLVVGVLGCLAERDGLDLIRRMPVVDLLCGPGELDKLPTLLDNALRTRIALAQAGEHQRSARQAALQGSTSRRSATLAAAQDDLELLDLSRAISPTDHNGSAYVRITRGCNKFCTYCVVPFTRGAEIHRPPEHIIDECKRLADAGVLEVTLLGQTVNHYRFEHDAAVAVGGVVQPQKGRSYAGGHRRDPFQGHRVTTFADLLFRIHEEVPALQRIRFVTSYPRDFGDDILDVMRQCPRLCRYLHVPVQSGSDRILKAMNRGYTVGEYLEFLGRARAALHQPDLGRPLMISADVIVGFPGETEDDFNATAALLENARFKSCFIFKYSPRPGTVAFDRLPDDVSEADKRRRNNHLLAIQTRISDDISRELIGETFEVFVEGVSRKTLKRQGLSHGQIRKTGGAVAITVGGRSLDPHAEAACATAPADEGPVQLSGRTEGDNIVFFNAPDDPAPWIGRIVPVRITQADRLSLHGELAPTDLTRG
ncbi:MAG: MiaB/RimO family radical SAM methylthiotransferase [Phycisphaeraceae bacterium]|nr:MiaB/RimO family radical SAM methylthiotransferase [Phycisphaeraceae bacterium]MCW5755420.1 MiaB/RimO family radical SAM methylthiotransferase [Phycisphaeraceae bacterium]